MKAPTIVLAYEEVIYSQRQTWDTLSGSEHSTAIASTAIVGLLCLLPILFSSSPLIRRFTWAAVLTILAALAVGWVGNYQGNLGMFWSRDFILWIAGVHVAIACFLAISGSKNKTRQSNKTK